MQRGHKEPHAHDKNNHNHAGNARGGQKKKKQIVTMSLQEWIGKDGPTQSLPSNPPSAFPLELFMLREKVEAEANLAVSKAERKELVQSDSHTSSAKTTAPPPGFSLTPAEEKRNDVKEVEKVPPPKTTDSIAIPAAKSSSTHKGDIYMPPQARNSYSPSSSPQKKSRSNPYGGKPRDDRSQSWGGAGDRPGGSPTKFGSPPTTRRHGSSPPISASPPRNMPGRLYNSGGTAASPSKQLFGSSPPKFGSPPTSHHNSNGNKPLFGSPPKHPHHPHPSHHPHPPHFGSPPKHHIGSPPKHHHVGSPPKHGSHVGSPPKHGSPTKGKPYQPRFGRGGRHHEGGRPWNHNHHNPKLTWTEKVTQNQDRWYALLRPLPLRYKHVQGSENVIELYSSQDAFHQVLTLRFICFIDYVAASKEFIKAGSKEQKDALVHVHQIRDYLLHAYDADFLKEKNKLFFEEIARKKVLMRLCSNRMVEEYFDKFVDPFMVNLYEIPQSAKTALYQADVLLMVESKIILAKEALYAIPNKFINKSEENTNETKDILKRCGLDPEWDWRTVFMQRNPDRFKLENDEKIRQQVKDSRYYQGGYRQNLGHFFTLMKTCVEMHPNKVHPNYRPEMGEADLAKLKGTAFDWNPTAVYHKGLPAWLHSRCRQIEFLLAMFPEMLKLIQELEAEPYFKERAKKDLRHCNAILMANVSHLDCLKA